MLVVTRSKRPGKNTILLADGMIKIIVSEVKANGEVKLAIECPRDIDIKRAEIVTR